MLNHTLLTSLVMALFLSAMPLYANETKETSESAMHNHKALSFSLTKQTHPMPNYMRILKKNIRLKLTDEQQTKLDAWVEQNHTKTAKTARKIVQLETEIASDSMNGTNKDALMSKLEQSLELRRELATGKIACRDTLRSVLTKDQWQEFVK